VLLVRWFVVVLRFVLWFFLRLGRFVLLPRLLFFLLLFLLELLLLLLMALFQLLQLFLLAFLDLLLIPLVVLRLNPLLLLHLLLFDSLAFAVLLLTQILGLLLMFLVELRVHGRIRLLARRRRPVIVTTRIRIVPIRVRRTRILSWAILPKVVVRNRGRPVRVRRRIHLIGLIRAISYRVGPVTLRRYRTDGRRHMNDWARRLRLHLAFLSHADGASTIRLNRLLLSSERHWCRRRCRFRDDWTSGESRSRPPSRFTTCSQTLRCCGTTDGPVGATPAEISRSSTRIMWLCTGCAEVKVVCDVAVTALLMC
jgi:hypothetical protein